MKLAIVQNEVSENKAENLEQVLALIEKAASQKADLILLPELWNTPFINSSIQNHADEWDDLIPPLQEAARKHGLWILAGSLPRKDGNRLYNSCAVINDKGEIIAIADKTHLLEVHTTKHAYYESGVFTPGKALCKVDSPWGKIAVLICYDNRFPEAARTLCSDCFLLAAPCGFNEKVGQKHWQPLFQTRAMENQVFAAAANPAGKDYGSYKSYGHSQIVDPDGVLLGQLDEKCGLLLADLDPSKVQRIRQRSPFWKIRRTDLYSCD